MVTFLLLSLCLGVKWEAGFALSPGGSQLPALQVSPRLFSGLQRAVETGSSFSLSGPETPSEKPSCPAESFHG